MSKKDQTRLTLITTFLLLGVILAGCSGPPSPLIGLWKFGEEFLFIEFKTGGVFEVTELGGITQGSYEMVDADTVSITYLGEVTSLDFVISEPPGECYSVNNCTLSISDGQNEPAVYTKLGG